MIVQASIRLFFGLALGTHGLLLVAQGAFVEGRLHALSEPLPYVNVSLVGTSYGSTSDEKGRFRIGPVEAGTYVLKASNMGFVPLERSIDIAVGEDLDLGPIELVPSSLELNEVVVTGTLKEVSRLDSPIPVEVITPALFRKNPEPSLLGSVGMVNGVRPQLNCSVCNTGDIHINGMEGPYTLVLIDGMPIVSSLGTVYGLSGIPNSMVERIEVVKGPGGALYGSEAMGGIINVITRSPHNSPRWAADAFVTGWNEQNLDLSTSVRSGTVRGLLSVNGFRYDDPRDDNGDGFTDLTLQERYSLFGKVDLARSEERVASLGARYLHEDRWGGEMNWTPEFAGTDSIYGEAVETRRWEVLGQYQLPVKDQVMFQTSLNGHMQDSWYGTTRFTATQNVAFGQLWWDRALGAQHELLAGVSVRHTVYDDNTPGTASGRGQNTVQRTTLPGIFLQDEWRLATERTLLMGLRVDHHPLHGVVPGPRLAFRWHLPRRQTIRASIGTGFRVVNLFTEDHAALTGSREVVVTEDLLPERSVGVTLNYVRSWSTATSFRLVDVSAWYTRFSNQIIGDFDTDPDKIIFANLNGHAISQGISVNGEVALSRGWKFLIGGSWMNVFRVDELPDGEEVLVKQLFAPEWSGTLSLSWRPNAWAVDLTGQWYGPMRLPVQPYDPRPEHSPWYAMLNVQLTRSLPGGFELYGGLKNLLDMVPKDVLLRPEDPFDKKVDDPVDNPNGHTFDTAYMYAPLQGLRGFFGVRWMLQ